MDVSALHGHHDAWGPAAPRQLLDPEKNRCLPGGKKEVVGPGHHSVGPAIRLPGKLPCKSLFPFSFYFEKVQKRETCKFQSYDLVQAT